MKTKLEKRCEHYQKQLEEFSRVERTAQFMIMKSVYKLTLEIQKKYNGKEVKDLLDFCNNYRR